MTLAAWQLVTATQAGAVTGPAPSCSAGTCTVTFHYAAGGQSWTVPTGVGTETLTLYGAKGGTTDVSVPGGLGAKVTGTLQIAAGTSVLLTTGGAGGFNVAGSNGGSAGEGDSGGGGGATDVRVGGSGLAQRVLVAGGGGGAGFGGIDENGETFVNGGTGGNADGAGGAGQALPTTAEGATLHGGSPAAGATGSAGGAGGAGSTVTGSDHGNCESDSSIPADASAGEVGGTGTPGTGGVGGYYGGGGGGGGYYGGGGGGGDASDSCGADSGAGGGGGGSSYVGSATGASITDGVAAPGDAPNGEIVVQYADPLAMATPSYGVVPGTTLSVAAPGALKGATVPSGDALTLQVLAQPTHGSLTLHDDGSFSYTPAAGYTGSDSFTFEASDAAGDMADGSVSLTPQSPGYVEVGANGAVFAYGTSYLGGANAITGGPGTTITGVTAMPDGGYVEVGANGAVFAYGTSYLGGANAITGGPGTTITGVAG
ncbi:MAG: Ig-like domain-containing protein [Acidimicrobiales bacterium]